MGRAAPWLAYTNHHNGNRNRSALAFLDHPANLRYPNKWFVGQTPYAGASFALVFNEMHASGGET